MWGQAFVIVMASPPPPLPTSTSVLIDEKSYLSNRARAAGTVFTFMLRRNFSTSSGGELEKSSLACGTPVRMDSAVLSEPVHRMVSVACLLPMYDGAPFTKNWFASGV